MAEPQPSTIRPGPTDIDEEGFETTTTTTVPTSAEDRKTAAALSSVSAHVDDDDEDRKVGKEVDREALGRAMKSLDLSVGHTSDGGAGAGAGACGGSSSSSKSKGGRMLEDDDEQSKKKSIKVDPVDVTIVMDELEMSKVKATDLLRTHGGDVVKAIQAFVTGDGVVGSKLA